MKYWLKTSSNALLSLLISLLTIISSSKAVIIQFERFQLTSDEISHKNFEPSKFNEFEFKVLKLISDWFSHQDTFVFKTSGSTGKQKIISVDRKMIEYSTASTFDVIDPNRKTTSSLLCLDPKYIGGAMVIFRAMIMNHDLKIIKPSSNPLEALDKEEHFGITSMAPMQYMKSDTGKINQIENILIGGAPIDVDIRPNLKANVYATFGMTETISHFALRKMDEDVFTTTGNATISVNDDSSMNLKGTITNGELLKTNDVIELISETKFKWIGRKDFIINSGGIKLNPERIERKISDQLQQPYLMSSVEDALLGEKLVLVIEGSEYHNLDFLKLSKYEVPKEIITIPKIPTTENGKLDRLRTRMLITELG